MPLSLSTTTKFSGFSSAENTASSASPLPSDASPMRQTTFSVPPARSRALPQPDARRERVAAVPRDKRRRIRSPRGRGSRSRRPLRAARQGSLPVSSLCAYAWCPTSKHELILREVEHLVQREDELHRAEVGGEVPAALFGGGNELPAQSARERLKLFYHSEIARPPARAIIK